MKIAGLELENFMGYRKFKRSFRDKEVIGLVGDNKTGKTTILEAIFWILFGVSRAERDVELIHRGQEKTMGKLTLDDDGKKIAIWRGRDSKNNGMLEIFGVEKKGEVQAVINKLIGYDKDEFGLTNFFKQMDINQFMELIPAKKKKYLMQWLKNTHWNDLERAALDDLSEESKKMADLHSKIETLEEQIGDTKGLKKKLSRLRLQHDGKAERAKRLERKVSKALADRKTLTSLIEQVEDLKEQIVERQSATAEVKLKKHLVAKRKIKMAERVVEDTNWKSVDVSKLLDSRARIKNRLKITKEKVDNAEKEFKGWCPLLKSPCSLVKPDSESVDEWKHHVKADTKALKKINRDLAYMEAMKDAQDAVKEAELALAEAKTASGGVDVLKEQLKSAQAKIGDMDPKEMGGMDDRLDDLKDEMADLSEQIGRVKQKIVQGKRVKDELSRTKEKLTGCQERAADLRYLAFMFGKNGIPSQEIENAFDEIEDEINFILQRLGVGLQVEFRPDREIGAWEDLCVECGWQFPKGTRTKECQECDADRMKKRKDELQLRVLEDGFDEGFHMESGGGKTMVSLSVRLALTRLKQRQTHSRFNVLFLDEPDAALDKLNKKAFVQLITRTLVKEFGFEQVFWISHDKEIQESIPHVLAIKKVNGQSLTTWVN